MKIRSSFFKTLTLSSFIVFCFNAFLVQSVFAQANDDTIEEIKPLKVYDIEIILFKNRKVPKAKEKILPTQAPLLDKQFISFTNLKNIEAASELDFFIPQDNELRLIDIVKKIKRSSRYKLLKHMAWRQPGLEKNSALAVQIRAGKLFGNDYSSIDNPVATIKRSSEKQEFKAINLSKQSTKSKKVWYELEGKITITLARYLHTYVDLVLRIPNENTIQFNSTAETPEQIDKQEAFSFSSATLNNFAFKEHRRMRSRKLHYLDHPELGMLILITPYEEPQNIDFIEDINNI